MSSLNVNAAAFVPPSVLAQPVSTQTSKPVKEKRNSSSRRNRNKKKTPGSPRRTGQHNQRRGDKQGRGRHNRKKESHQDEPDEPQEGQDGNELEETKQEGRPLHDFLFPPLAPTTATVFASATGSGWSNVAKEGHAAEDRRLEREALQRDTIERNMTLLSLNVITAIVDEDITPEEPLPVEDASVVQQETPSIRQLDMRKMRDRWWQVVKEKRARDAEEFLQRQRDAQCDETASEQSSYCDESVDSDKDEESEVKQHVFAYDNVNFPLHRAIIDDDDQAVRRLLQQQREELFAPVSRRQLGLAVSMKLFSEGKFTPLHLAVYLDRPHLLRTLLGDTGLVKAAESMDFTPLMLAAELSVDGCIKQLLGRGGGAALTCRDKARGETAIHYACRAGVPSATLKILLTWQHGGGQMQKPLSSRNHKGQTPFHVACEGAHTHLVEAFLQICAPSLLQRLLRIQDDQQQTPLLAAVAAEAFEVVMALLMWRGNHQDNGKFYRPAKESNEGPCPLAWSVLLGSMEMVHVLLEFSDADGYNLDAALQAAIRSSSESRHEIVRVLVDAGANPGAADVGLPVDSPTTAFSIAAVKGDASILGILIETYQHQLKERQVTRRQDPRLQKQPETYFRSIEETEAIEVQMALNDALVRSLWLGWKESRFDRLQAGVLLFKKGSLLRDTDFARLKRSIVEYKLKTADEVVAENERYVYESDYIHYGMPDDDKAFKLGAYDKSPLAFWTKILLKFPWMQEEDGVQCAWILAEQGVSANDHLPLSSTLLETITLVAQGCRFSAHNWIISQKCAKLAAAIRFAKISQGNDEDPIEIEVEMSSKQCKWLLQHIYSGSLLSGWGPNTCEELFELSLLAQEFICPSLVQECEMRLLSSNVSQCFCWSCCLAVRKTGKNSAQCLYRAKGPSKALTSQTAIDALALSEQLNCFDTNEYLIKFWPYPNYPSSSDVSTDHAWNHYNSNARLLTTPFTAVKDAAIGSMLLDYCKVLKSESFLNQVKSMLDDSDSEESIANQALEAQVMLLQLCLDELAGSTMVRVETLASNHPSIDRANSRTKQPR